MTQKDDSGEVISKRVLDSLTGLITLAAALTTIFGVFFSEEKAKPLAFGIAFLLVLVSGGVFIYQRRRAAKLKIAESLEPLSATAALRGLLPFEEADQLPGRARDVQELYTLISSRSFRYGVLWGVSGCGKTSLLRAGLIPKLRNEKFVPLYIDKPTDNPQEAIRSALLREFSGLEKQTSKNLSQLLASATPKGKFFVIVFDQFEEYFLTNRAPKSRASFIKWLGESIADEDMPVIFLICIRADLFYHLQNLAPEIPEPTSIHTTYQLQDFDIEQAKQIFSAAAKADGISFKPELIQAVIRELETDEFVRPAELQIVGTRLKRKHVFSIRQYEALGGARGILSSYITDVIKQSPNELTARLVLRMMCDETGEAKSPTDFSVDDILRGINGEGSASRIPRRKAREVQTILKQFINARVLIRRDDDKYNLVHDYLAAYVRAATEGTETDTERANQMLKLYVAQYKEDSTTRIPFGRIRWLQKHASFEVKGKDKAQELIKKSRRAFLARVSLLSPPLILLFGLYFFYLTQAYYFSIENSYIVLRAGSPRYTFLPGFGRVAIQTDFKRENLKDDNIVREEIDQGKVAGFWFNRAEAGYQLWGEQLKMRLETISQAQMLHLLGDPVHAAEILMKTITDSQADSDLRSEAMNALGSLAQAQPQAVTPDMLQKLLNIITDPFLRSDATSALGSLAQAQPQAVTPDMLQKLMNIITDPKPDHFILSDVTSALGSLAQAQPQAVTPDMLQKLLNIVTDAHTDFFVRYDVTSALGSLAQAQPQAVTPDMLQKLMNIITDPKADSDLRSDATSALGSLAQAQPQAVTPDMLQAVMDIVANPKADPGLLSAATVALGSLAQAQPQAVTPDMLQAVMDIITDPIGDSFLLVNDPSLLFNAIYALGQLAQAQPHAVTPDMLPAVMATFTDPNLIVLASVDNYYFYYLHSDATSALREIAEARPEAVTPHMLAPLLEIIVDPMSDGDLHTIATTALESFVQARPDAVTPELIASSFDLVIDPKADPVVRNDTAYLLGSLAQARPDAVTPELHQSLMGLLKRETDSPGRIAAAYALFGFSFGDKEHEAMIRPEMEASQDSPQPHGRMAASRALEMILISNLTEEALSNPEQIAHTKSRLNYLIALGDPRYSLYLKGEEHLGFAALLTLREIEKIAPENK